MLEQSSFWPEEHLVSLSRSPGSELDWMTLVATSPPHPTNEDLFVGTPASSLPGLLADSAPYGWCGRTSPAFCRSTGDGRLAPSSGCWASSGMGSHTEFLTLDISEYPSDAVASSLSNILETGELPQAVLLERHSLSGHPPPSPRARQGAARGVEVGPSGGRLTEIAPTLDRGCKNGFVRSQLGAGVIASTGVTARCLNAGAVGRQDFETETLIAHALSADGFDASEDGTGRGVPIVPVAFSAKDHGADAGNLAPTLRSMGHHGAHANGGGQLAVAFSQNQSGDVLTGEVMHALGTNPNATGRNAPTVAFTLHGSDGTAGAATPANIAGAVRTRAPGSIENSSTTVAQHGLAVRRLTPRECERLQGFPVDYTLVEYRGRLAADGPRYRALGNSMAVPVMRWVGERIASVEAILGDQLGTGRLS